MSKNILIFAIVCVVVLLAGIALYNERRPLPFQEVIALDNGVAVVNSQKWFVDNLQISYSSNGENGKRVDFDKHGVCVIQNLVNGQEYAIEVSRTDLKGMLLYTKLKAKVTPHEGGDDYYVLVGASVGKAWNIGKLPERLKLKKNIVLGNRTVYQFNKSEVVDDLTKLPFQVTGVILKECSAYFPRDIEQSKKDLMSWVDTLLKNGVKPILATTVPVTVTRAKAVPDKQRSLLRFNDFIYRYSKNSKLQILDLEKMLRVSDNDRHLRDDYAQDDGTHLIEKAYREALDPIVFPVLEFRPVK